MEGGADRMVDRVRVVSMKVGSAKRRTCPLTQFGPGLRAGAVGTGVFADEWAALLEGVPEEQRGSADERAFRDVVRLVKAARRLGRAIKRLQAATLNPAAEGALLELRAPHSAGVGADAGGG
ncbi:hypothetical protein CYMTET_49943 [Cymbomonas tetramitiformis]|uniref:Uncharacterized protein n=1 Tax=Cymbomonas tetramitiformis TaxID=36881 RepID=A0AAE0EVA9_9CHLO|nr:hypothetical protein CYMTET_49943 [Cymbomonas tetramitiformis]